MDKIENIYFEIVGQVAHPFADNQRKYASWLNEVAHSENKMIEELTFIFCDDEYLLDINIKHLGHDYYTDIITFPYKEGDIIKSDLFISIDRVLDNAETYHVSFVEELARVMVHGVLHLMGYGDKEDQDILMMRSKEDYYINQLLVTIK